MSPTAKSGWFDASIRPAPMERTTSPILTAGRLVVEGDPTAREQPLPVFHGLSSHGDLSDLYIREPSAPLGAQAGTRAITAAQCAQILTTPGAPHIAQGEKLKR
jgi:hypothetical protein